MVIISTSNHIEKRRKKKDLVVIPVSQFLQSRLIFEVTIFRTIVPSVPVPQSSELKTRTKTE